MAEAGVVCQSRMTHYNIMGLAKQEERLFGIEKFEKYLFREAHTYTKAQFEERFVQVMEQEEDGEKGQKRCLSGEK